ncbi:hypothetical protein K1719_012141 [Acacia pycnantha]|nr:hypothetical protein K1719_012141 [Acacia pycnantha]
MKFPLLSIIASLTVMLGAMHAALPPEIYWKSKLPNTPMPEFLKDLLHPTVNVGNISGGTTNRSVRGWNEEFEIFLQYPKLGYINYRSYGSANMTQLLHNSNETMFFLEKDLNAGRKMNLHFTHRIITNASFLPRQVVKSIPFSSSKMDEILNNFNLERGSVVAKVMKDTINICEEPGMKGEERYCATSLESMVDFVTSVLGKSVKALPLEATNQTKEDEYKIMEGVKKVGDTQVVCHKMTFVYAVYLCHKIDNTVAYTVPLEGADGSRIKALCVCHRDTSNWSPRHLSFQLLKVKPGTVPICHFLSQGTVMWVAKQN